MITVDSQYILSQLKIGKQNGIKAKEFYARYKNNGGTSSFSTFDRQLRKVNEIARRQKKQIIGDNNGFYLAETDEEWEKWKKKIKSRIMNELHTLAMCTNRPEISLLKEWYFNKKPKTIDPESDLFGDLKQKKEKSRKRKK
ncbi:MAG: hypothetical protein A2V66_16725 [Ignavibacteria bacterium RBG_13_36_8]|nr:MAG: hypothetical protein A2V66_16725 [Ignavibacteria bacterium RBG_13_36_8]